MKKMLKIIMLLLCVTCVRVYCAEAEVAMFPLDSVTLFDASNDNKSYTFEISPEGLEKLVRDHILAVDQKNTHPVSDTQGLVAPLVLLLVQFDDTREMLLNAYDNVASNFASSANQLIQERGNRAEWLMQDVLGYKPKGSKSLNWFFHKTNVGLTDVYERMLAQANELDAYLNSIDDKNRPTPKVMRAIVGQAFSAVKENSTSLVGPVDVFNLSALYPVYFKQLSLPSVSAFRLKQSLRKHPVAASLSVMAILVAGYMGIKKLFAMPVQEEPVVDNKSY